MTLNDICVWFPELSNAVYVTVVCPEPAAEKVVPGSWVEYKVSKAQLSVGTGATQFTTAEQRPASVFTGMSVMAGITGSSSSTTVTTKLVLS